MSEQPPKTIWLPKPTEDNAVWRIDFSEKTRDDDIEYRLVETCTWLMTNDGEVWSRCERKWRTEKFPPTESNYEFCPYCGRRINIVREEHDDE